MTTEQKQVKEWMLMAEQDCPPTPSLEPAKEIRDLRYFLIKEELEELRVAQLDCNRIGIADAIADLMYVVLGTAVAYGIDIEPVFQEVHRSNMTKFIDGHKNIHGKWIKGPSYSPATLQPIIERQCV